MEYRKMGGDYYIRMDKGDEIISQILGVCKKEGILSATFSGIGGCQDAQIQTFIPERGEFGTECLEGTLELINIMGNVVSDDEDNLYHHTHALFSYIKNGEHCMSAGHMKATTVLYTAEILLHPVTGGCIRRKYDPETGTGFWNFTEEEKR